MDFFITFFRDILDGPLYIVIAVISGILICSCIGYLAEQSINKKKQKNQYNETHATVDSSNDKNISEVVTTNQVMPNVTSQSVQNINPVVTGLPVQNINPAVTGVPTSNTTVQVGQQQSPFNSQNMGQ